MKYASLADIVNGFDGAKTWKFIRKGKNNWSLIGIGENGFVTFEVENLYLAQIQSLVKDVKEDAEIVEIENPDQTVRRDLVTTVLYDSLAHLTGGESNNSKEHTIHALKTLWCKNASTFCLPSGPNAKKRYRGRSITPRVSIGYANGHLYKFYKDLTSC